MRKSIALFAFALLISTTWSIIYLPEVVVAGSPPPPDDGIDGLQYIDGDWNVNGIESYTNETIVLTGNLTIEYGGNLTFKNVTLLMNSTTGGATIDDYYHIEVQKGGTMYVLDYDSDNTTIYDTSNITLNDTAAKYWFWVRDGSNFTMRNSELHECGGWSISSTGAGLMIYTDNATIKNSLISYNKRDAIVLYNSDAHIINNTISWNDRSGIVATWWSNGTIENNIISWSDTYGIWVNGWDNTERKSSNPLIKNNTIYKTARDGPGGVGIQITAFSNPTIEDTKIIDWGEDAIYFGQWCQATVNNCTFDAQGGNYALASSAPRNVTVTNSTIENNNVLWDLSLATAYFEMTNCSFNQSKVIFQGTDSNLTVNWFLNSYVNDTSGNPIPNANIRIRDNANGTFDENFTSDSNGFVNWTVLKEYFQKDNNGDKDGDDVGERIDYGPYNITVEKNGYYTNYSVVQMNTSKYITITLQTQDTEKPEINHVPVISANVGEAINITANITDDVGVDAVKLDYTGINGTNYNVSMSKWNDDWYYDIPGQPNTGFVDYFIWCNDTTGNDNQTTVYQVQIFDVIDPEINHAPITSANISEIINITTNVTDDVSVDSVYLNYTGINGTSYNVSMQKWNGNYSCEIPGQNTIGTVSYFIWANDSDGNDNRTIGYSIQINDVTKPEINHTPVTSANISEWVNIIANITDNIEVNAVYLNYTNTNGTNYYVPMILNNGNWSYIIPGQTSGGIINYFIWCNDTSGNENQTTAYQITVELVEVINVTIPDTAPPTILSKSATGVNISISSEIILTFDEPMNTSSVEDAITISPAITISSYNWNADNTTLTITPSGNLSYNTTYNVTVGIGAKYLSGNVLESPYSLEFITEVEKEPEPPNTNEHEDNWLAEYWWVIVIIAMAIIITVYLFQRFRIDKETEEEVEEKEQE